MGGQKTIVTEGCHSPGGSSSAGHSGEVSVPVQGGQKTTVTEGCHSPGGSSSAGHSGEVGEPVQGQATAGSQMRCKAIGELVSTNAVARLQAPRVQPFRTCRTKVGWVHRQPLSR